MVVSARLAVVVSVAVNMRRLTLLATALVTLAACEASPEEKVAEAKRAREASVRIQALEIGGKPVRCLQASDLEMYMPSSYELEGDVRARFLTLEANNAKVRIFVSGSTVSDYGSIVVYYVNEQRDCLLWMETLGIQEYAEKAGLNPLGIAQGYEAAKSTPAPAAPAK